MASWGKIDSNGKRMGRNTAFPPTSYLPGERIIFRDRIAHNSGSFPEKYHFSIDDGPNNVTAKFLPASPRGTWEIEIVAADVPSVRSLLNKMLTNLGLHGTYVSK